MKYEYNFPKVGDVRATEWSPFVYGRNGYTPNQPEVPTGNPDGTYWRLLNTHQLSKPIESRVTGDMATTIIIVGYWYLEKLT